MNNILGQKNKLTSFFCFTMLYCSALQAQTISNAGAPFERIDLSIKGPSSDERGAINPFTDVRLDWTITHEGQSWTIPGYFAGCDKAADTGCTSGDLWRAHFVPPKIGEYQWNVRFVTGEDIAISAAKTSPINGNDSKGNFTIKGQSSDPIIARGLLQYTGERYYKYAGDQSIFFKFGPDAPENMLAYDGFDDTPNYKNFRKNWDAHKDDLKADGAAYQWGAQKNGAGLLGMFDYLANSGANSVSMLLWNAGGDDRNVFPHLMSISAEEYIKLKPREQWANALVQDRFDISKLDQWARVFEYATKRGLHLHFKLQETENDSFMDDGTLGRTRRIYLREMVARFGHNLALSWNIGEENVQRAGDVRQIASYIESLDAYNHPIVLHSYPDQKERYRPFLGPDSALNGLSLQGRNNDISDLRGDVTYWTSLSLLAGKPLVLAYDEPGRADGGAGVDPDYPDDQLPSKREVVIDPEDFIRNGLWNALTAGANGVEAYYGYKTGCSDLDCQDHRTRARLWREGAHALSFFRNHVGDRANQMFAADHITTDNSDYILAQPGEFFIIVLGKEDVVLTGGSIEGRFNVKWYDRVNGGALQDGSVKNIISGARNIPIGQPPNDGKWVAIISRDDDDIMVEAENFNEQRLNQVRNWCKSSECPAGWERAGTADYVALVPDTRKTHDDPVVRGENFSNEPGKLAILSYDVDFPSAGRWYLWVRAFASGSEDNGLHAGINGTWPESSARIQYCPGRGQWYWDSRQRTADNHCGVRGGLWIDVDKAGKQRVEFSMREDGFVFDAFYLTRSPLMPPHLQSANDAASVVKIKNTGH